MPSAVVYVPLEYGGMEITESYTLQDQLQAQNLIKHLRWGGKPANDILVTLDNIQLVAGFIQPVTEKTARRLD